MLEAENIFFSSQKGEPPVLKGVSLSVGRGDAILDELARMLGSDTITESSLANARELKEMAANTKQY